MKSTLPIAFFYQPRWSHAAAIKMVDESLWLTQQHLAGLYEKPPKTIREHINNIYSDGELEPGAAIRLFRVKSRTVALEGAWDRERLLNQYNLDSVLAVGYRVRSNRGTLFRQWPTQL